MKIPYKIFSLIFAFFLIFVSSWHPSSAQSPDGVWANFENISLTNGSSSYPVVISDQTGLIHALWSEDASGKAGRAAVDSNGDPVLDPRGNPINILDSAGGTIYYAQYDGTKWGAPKDLFDTTSGILEYPDAVVDTHGILHAVWMGSEAQTGRLVYSHVSVSDAGKSSAWSQAVVLAEPILAAYYPVAIVADTNGGLHIAYSSLGSSPGLMIINSDDGGTSWSNPLRIYATLDSTGGEEGISPIRLVIDKQDRLHVTFTRYGKDGNGKAVYYAQSNDLGRTWSVPYEVAVWQPGYYEVDWLSAGIVKDEIHLIWEGGTIAFLNERISRDGGKTWGEAHQILPNLVGENGFADLVVDSADQLYMLVVKRGDGFTLTNGIWYSHWIDNQWDYPYLLGTKNYALYSTARSFQRNELQYLLRGTFTGDGIRYQRATVANGNKLFVVTVNEWGGEIFSTDTQLQAPEIAPKEYPTPMPTSKPTQEQTQQISPTPLVTDIPQSDLASSSQSSSNFYVILLSALSSVAFVFVIGLVIRKLRK